MRSDVYRKVLVLAVMTAAACSGRAEEEDAIETRRSAVNTNVVITVRNQAGTALQGVKVRAQRTNGTWVTGTFTTNAQGNATITLGDGAYRFRGEDDFLFFWSGAAGHCVTPGCTSASITINTVTVTVADPAGAPQPGHLVTWWNTAGDDGEDSAETPANGQARLALIAGSYQFSVRINGLEFWSGDPGHCVVPTCTAVTITITQPVMVTVVNAAGAPVPDLLVSWENTDGDDGAYIETDASGHVEMSVPPGATRFSVRCPPYDSSAETFYSGPIGHCVVPGCISAQIIMRCGHCTGKPNGFACTDDNGCTQNDACQGGRCASGAPVTCTASDQCHLAGTCSFATGACSNPAKPNGTACNDANACTQTDTCQTGTCTGSNPVTCTASDQCHDPGTCAPATGVCSNPNKANGTACNDSNACTQSDTCQGGACTGANPIVCGAQDQCHTAGTCNPSTGTCSNARVADGAACEDGNRCSVTDACHAGTCLPGPETACSAAGAAKYVSVINLGSSQGWSYASGINNQGVVVGTDTTMSVGIYQHGLPGSRAYRWSAAEGMVYLPTPGEISFAMDINDAGVISGTARPAGWSSGMAPFRYDPAVDSAPRLQTNAGNGGRINASGMMAGSGYYTAVGPNAFRIGAGAVEVLAAVPHADPADMRARGYGIDGDGTVVGDQLINGGGQAMRYRDGRGPELLNHLLPGGMDWNLIAAGAVRGGEILGWGYRGGLGRAYRLRTTANGDFGDITELGIPAPYGPSAPNIVSAASANASGEIVGSVYDGIPFWPENAFVYTDATRIINLNTLVDPESGWHLSAAFSINDSHEVVGYGYYDGLPRAYKLKLPDLSPCVATDACHLAGARDPLTGVCTNPLAPNGTACNDNNVCTLTDSCQTGVCTGGGESPACALAPGLTPAQIAAARAAGLLPSAYPELTIFEPLGDPPNDVSTIAAGINNSGAIAGYTHPNLSTTYAVGNMAYPFVADSAGQRRLTSPWPTGPAYGMDVNDAGDVLGQGGPATYVGGNDFMRPVVYRPDGSQLFPWAPLRYQAYSMNNTVGSGGLATIVGNAVNYNWMNATSGTLSVWHFNNDGTDALGPSGFTMPPTVGWAPGHTSAPGHTPIPGDAAVVLDGSTCLSTSSVPNTGDTAPYVAAGITMLGWVNPDASMCPGMRAVASRGTEFSLWLECNAAGTAVALTAFARTSTGDHWTTAAGTIPFGQWSHVAVTWDKARARSFVNGALVGDQALTGQIGPTSTWASVGCYPSTPPVPGANFMGAIDEVSVFQNGMGADEIALNARGMTNYKSYPPSDQMHGTWARIQDGFFNIVTAPRDPVYAGWGIAYHVNNAGKAVGFQHLTNLQRTAVLYDPVSGWLNLNDLLPIDNDWDLQDARGIDEAGRMVVGTGLYYGRPVPFRLDLWTGEVVALGDLPDWIYQYPGHNDLRQALARGINARGDTVGYISIAAWNTMRAFLHTNGVGLVDLNNLKDPASPWVLRDAYGINDNGEIVGWASLGENGAQRAFKMRLPVMPSEQQVACMGKADGDVCSAGGGAGGEIDVA